MIQKCLTLMIKQNIKEHNLNCPQSPDNPYRILIIGGSGSRKPNLLFNLISHLLNIDKIYLYAKYSFEAKYQFLINRKESTGLKHFSDSKAVIKYENNIDDDYENINEYNPNKNRKILIAFDNLVVGMLNNKKPNPIVTELLIRGRKLKISFAFYHTVLFCCTDRY